jgi:hypothetical protein
MQTRSLHPNWRKLSQLLNSFLTHYFWSVLFFSLFTFLPLHAEPPIAQDTTSPNMFSFTSDTYYVDEDATNAMVAVEFTPGDRSWSGWVNYSVSNGTASAGEDYLTVSGTLYFSGPGTPVPQISIPIKKDGFVEGDETVQLFLWNTNAIITRATAMLVIKDKPLTPELLISPGVNGTILLSWPSNATDFVLEKSGQLFSENWSKISSPPNFNNGSCQVTENCSGPPMFYRLRKTSSP